MLVCMFVGFFFEEGGGGKELRVEGEWGTPGESGTRMRTELQKLKFTRTNVIATVIYKTLIWHNFETQFIKRIYETRFQKIPLKIISCLSYPLSLLWRHRVSNKLVGRLKKSPFGSPESNARKSTNFKLNRWRVTRRAHGRKRVENWKPPKQVLTQND